MTPWLLSFAERVNYEAESSIVIPISLSSDLGNSLPVRASLDTGSTFCVFPRYFADLLGLDLERGVPEWIGTATGSFLAYGHEVAVSTCGIEWQAVVYFAESEAFHICAVGRIGFLDRLRIALVEYEQELFLSAYED